MNPATAYAEQRTHLPGTDSAAADVGAVAAGPDTCTVALVDDHELVVASLSAALTHAGVGCTAFAPKPVAPLLDELLAAAPTLVLLDLDLGPFGDAEPLIAPLVAANVRVVVLTAETDRIRLAQAIEQGAVRIVPKSSAFAALVSAIHQAAVFPGVRRDLQAQKLLVELAAHRAEQAASRAPFDRLTEREQETLAELARGHSVQQIAARWVVSEATVRSHVRAILQKLDARSQLQAVVRAVHAGWIDPEASGDDADTAGYVDRSA